MEKLRLQLFADGGTVVNTTGGTVDAYTGAAVASTAMSPTMKTYYDTELLENSRPQLVFSQLGKKQPLLARHGKTVEWRKFNTFDKALTPLQEAVIPTGKQFGMTAATVENWLRGPPTCSRLLTIISRPMPSGSTTPKASLPKNRVA